MAHKTFFQRNEGGGNLTRFFIMLAFTATLFFSPLNTLAQPTFEVTTGFQVVITPRIFDPNGSNTCGSCCYPITCRRALYQVQLPSPPDTYCEYTFLTACATYSKRVCPTYDDSSKDDSPLNGVSTFDLVKITKHILGLEPFTSPYQFIAADANKTNSVTTYDNSELQKLILGIYDSFEDFQPNANTSWRFIDKTFYIDLNDPFGDLPFPESITGTLPLDDADFVAVKIGDVNLNAIVCDDCSAPRSSGMAAYRLNIPSQAVKSGEYVTVPLTANDDTPLLAWQLALRFDTRALELVSPSAGDLEGVSQSNFGLTRSGTGSIRALWMARMEDDDDRIHTGQNLFFLTFRAKNRIKDLSALIQLDETNLPCRGWTADGNEFALQLTPDRSNTDRSSSSGNTLAARCRPNPSSGAVLLDFDLPEAARVRLSVYDAFGVRVLFREAEMPVGEQTLSLPEATAWIPGVYRYDLRAGKKASAKGHIIKQ